MKIALLGYGIEGLASLRHWQSPDNQITICDANPDLEIPDECTSSLGPDYLKGLDKYDLLVRAPGLKPSDIYTAPSSV